MHSKILAFLLVFAAVIAPAMSAPLTVTVVDGSGHPMPNAVVALVPNEASRMPAPQTALRATEIIDQKNEMFMPLVTVVPVGGAVVFTNSDHTMHHVYSFAPIRQFEFVLNQGEKSDAVHFDHAGIAAIGCNIHDQMIAYVYVTASPWTAITGPSGIAHFELPAGAYRTSLWHPEIAPGREVPSTSVVMGNASVAVTLTMPRLAVRAHTSAHRGDY
jgi:plastocyanin